MNTLASDVYTGTAVVGKVQSIIGAIAVTAVGLFFIVISVALIRKKNIYTGRITGIVQKSGSITTVSYSVSGKNYTTPLQRHYTVGQSVKLQYNPSNPADAQEATISPRLLGSIILAITIIVMLLTYISTYFTLKYKQFAATVGTEDILSRL